ncbi:MAG: GlsB/YeaQ/YmgE family stress response membrane protein [Pseudomonadota bacterium]
MAPIGLIIMLAIGAVAGWLAGLIMKGGGSGLIGNIIIGVVGAVIAGFLFPGLLPISGLLGQIASATLGAVLLLFVLGLIRR